jgi:hypothetical protein
MHTVAETFIFRKYASEIWSDAELAEFINWIAASPFSGAIITGSGGCRKIRWSRSGLGKRGGARVIYFIMENGVIWLLIAYTKAKFDNLQTSFLAELKKEVENAF